MYRHLCIQIRFNSFIIRCLGAIVILYKFVSSYGIRLFLFLFLPLFLSLPPLSTIILSLSFHPSFSSILLLTFHLFLSSSFSLSFFLSPSYSQSPLYSHEIHDHNVNFLLLLFLQSSLYFSYILCSFINKHCAIPRRNS